MTIEERIVKVEEALNHINHELGCLTGKQQGTNSLIKYVVLPLILIVGALAGVKIV